MKKVAVELNTGEKLEGYIVEPKSDAPILFKQMDNGIFLKTKTHISFLSHDSIKNLTFIKK